MAYAVTSDVASEFKNVEFTAQTPVTATEVTAFITQADGEINGYVGKVYTIPITGTESLAVMKMISVWLVAHRVSQILQVKTVTEETETGAKSLREQALELLDKIVKREFVLTDAPLLSSTGGFKSYASDNSLDYSFHKNRDEW